MILLFLLFSGTLTMNYITTVEKEIERPVGILTALVLKVYHLYLDLAFTPITLISDLLA